MELKSRTRHLLVALLVVVPLIDMAPASADGPLQSVVTHHQISYTNGTSFTDPTCPWSFANLPPASAEARTTDTVTFGSATGRETLYISYCLEHSSANGGVPYNGGDWTLVRKDGTLSGTVLWGAKTDLFNGGGVLFRLYLSTRSGTGSLEHAKGKLFFWTCDMGGGLRLTPKQQYYSVCKRP